MSNELSDYVYVPSHKAITASRTRLQHQFSLLPEHSCISMCDLVSLPALSQITEASGTLGEPVVAADTLNGESFPRWAFHRRFNTVCRQRDIVDDRADLNTTALLCTCAHKRVRSQLNSECNRLYKVPPTFSSDCLWCTHKPGNSVSLGYAVLHG